MPFYGKDSDRLVALMIAYKALIEAGELLENWPITVATCSVFKERIDIYDETQKEAVHGDHRWIAKRNDACNNAGTTWQKIVNYICSTEEDHSAVLAQMGVGTKQRSSTFVPPSSELQPPVLAIINLDHKGMVRGSCPRERRHLTWEMWVNEGDTRIEEGWYLKHSFADCTQMDMEGFQPGKEYSFRCRIIGRDNKPSPWSLVVTIIVT